MQEKNSNHSNYLIELKDVSMLFNMPTERITGLKEYFVKLVKGKLRYKKFVALRHISVKVPHGESLAIMGVNGAGKSTLLKIIAGVLTPTKGIVRVNGTIAPLLNLGAGFDMESTGKENIFLNGAMLGFSRKEMREKYDRIVKFAELEDFMDVPLKNYSSGMVARLGFAIAIDVNPDILLVDEILSVGDANFQKKCTEKIMELKEKGTTFILVSHSTERVKSMCQRALWIENSRMRMYGDSEKVCLAYEEDCREKYKEN